MDLSKIRELVSEVVSIPHNWSSHDTAVYISGGFDSTLVLHHLVAKGLCPRTFTACFGDDEDDLREQEAAKKVATWYDVPHTFVSTLNLFADLPEILSHFDRPRYNVWPWYLAKAAKEAACKTVFTGEGGDENFGYADRDYLTGWANQIAYIQPTYRYIHNFFGLALRCPFMNLPWREFIEVWEPDKTYLREAYHKILPDFVLDKPAAPPRFTNYWAWWRRTLSKHYAHKHPKTDEDVKFIFQLHVAKVWHEVHFLGGDYGNRT